MRRLQTTISVTCDAKMLVGTADNCHLVGKVEYAAKAGYGCEDINHPRDGRASAKEGARTYLKIA